MFNRSSPVPVSRGRQWLETHITMAFGSAYFRFPFSFASTTTTTTLHAMRPPPGQTNVPLPPISSEVKSRGVHFLETSLTSSPESYENHLPPEANPKVLGMSGLSTLPTLDRGPVIDPRLQMIKRRSQCETRLSPLHSFRKTMGVPFPESSPYAPTNFTPNWKPFPVRSHLLISRSCSLIIVNR